MISLPVQSPHHRSTALTLLALLLEVVVECQILLGLSAESVGSVGSPVGVSVGVPVLAEEASAAAAAPSARSEPLVERQRVQLLGDEGGGNSNSDTRGGGENHNVDNVDPSANTKTQKLNITHDNSDSFTRFLADSWVRWAAGRVNTKDNANSNTAIPADKPKPWTWPFNGYIKGSYCGFTNGHDGRRIEECSDSTRSVMDEIIEVREKESEDDEGENSGENAGAPAKPTKLTIGNHHGVPLDNDRMLINEEGDGPTTVVVDGKGEVAKEGKAATSTDSVNSKTAPRVADGFFDTNPYDSETSSSSASSSSFSQPFSDIPGEPYIKPTPWRDEFLRQCDAEVAVGFASTFMSSNLELAEEAEERERTGERLREREILKTQSKNHNGKNSKADHFHRAQIVSTHTFFRAALNILTHTTPNYSYYDAFLTRARTMLGEAGGDYFRNPYDDDKIIIGGEKDRDAQPGIAQSGVAMANVDTADEPTLHFSNNGVVEPWDVWKSNSFRGHYNSTAVSLRSRGYDLLLNRRRRRKQELWESVTETDTESTKQSTNQSTHHPTNQNPVAKANTNNYTQTPSRKYFSPLCNHFTRLVLNFVISEDILIQYLAQATVDVKEVLRPTATILRLFRTDRSWNARNIKGSNHLKGSNSNNTKKIPNNDDNVSKVNETEKVSKVKVNEIERMIRSAWAVIDLPPDVYQTRNRNQRDWVWKRIIETLKVWYACRANRERVFGEVGKMVVGKIVVGKKDASETKKSEGETVTEPSSSSTTTTSTWKTLFGEAREKSTSAGNHVDERTVFGDGRDGGIYFNDSSEIWEEAMNLGEEAIAPELVFCLAQRLQGDAFFHPFPHQVGANEEDDDIGSSDENLNGNNSNIATISDYHSLERLVIQNHPLILLYLNRHIHFIELIGNRERMTYWAYRGFGFSNYVADDTWETRWTLPFFVTSGNQRWVDFFSVPKPGSDYSGHHYARKALPVPPAPESESSSPTSVAVHQQDSKPDSNPKPATQPDSKPSDSDSKHSLIPKPSPHSPVSDSIRSSLSPVLSVRRPQPWGPVDNTQRMFYYAKMDDQQLDDRLVSIITRDLKRILNYLFPYRWHLTGGTLIAAMR